MRETILKYKQIIGFDLLQKFHFINFAEINQNNIKIIVDNNTLKHNRYTAGSNIKIVSSEINWLEEKLYWF